MAKGPHEDTDARIRLFSIQHLGYDPDKTGEASPRDALQWVKTQRERIEARRKSRGAIIIAVSTAILTTIAAGIVAKLWTLVSR